MSDTEDDEVLRKITTIRGSFDQKTTRLLEAELQNMKQERKAVAQEVEGPSPEPPTPPRPDEAPDYAEVEPPGYGRTLHHLSGDPVTAIGDYLKDVRVVPLDAVVELRKDGSPTLLAVPQQTVAIIHSLGLDYEYFTSILHKRKRRIGSE